MFKHIYLYRLKTLTRDRETLFWTLFFPVILGTFFYLGLSSISQANRFDPIPVAVVTDAAWEKDEAFKQTLRALSDGDSALFELYEVNEAEAIERLNAGGISGYLKTGETPELIVNSSNFGASVIQNFLNRYIQTAAAAQDLISGKPEQAQAILADLGRRETWIEDLQLSANEVDPLLNYFYTLIAMSCFYGSMIGMREINEIQANQSSMAARVNAAPTRKIRHFVYSSLASLTIHFLQIMLLLLYIRFILGIEFGHQTAYIVLTALAGALCGYTYGSFVSSLVKGSLGLKVAILISTTMLMSFFSGMMYAPMKQIVKHNLPFLALNPLTLITDAFFSLHYYEGYTRFGRYMFLLTAYTLLFTLLTYLKIRRPRYASI